MGKFCRGERGFSSTLIRYEIRMGLLLVLSWARVRRVSLGRKSSDGEILGAICCMSLLWLRCRRCVCTMLECICVELAVMLLLCDCVWVRVYVGRVVDVVECGLFLEPRLYGCIVSLCSGCIGCCAFCLICYA